MPKTIDDLLAEARATIDRVKPEEAYAALHAGAVIVDTRCADDVRAAGTAAGAIHVPMSVLEWRADPSSDAADPRLINATRIILMCNDGYSSSLSARNLRLLGHETAADIIGGFNAWKQAGLPVDGPSPDLHPDSG